MTNARTGNIEYIYEGDVLDAALASCALPVINKPVRIGTNYYIDGGITLNMPTVLPEHIQNTYPYVGINLANGASFRANKISRVRKDFIAAYANLFKKLNSSIETALDDPHDTKADYQLYELVIDDNSVGIGDFDKIAECIAIGERYTEAKIKELNNLNFAGF